LEDYHKQIEGLKEEMKGYSDNSELLKTQLRGLKNNCIKIPNNMKCDECLISVFTEEFYVFPCLHAFHKNCLLLKIKDETKKRRIEDTERKI
jgi:vacuolar protein sorting-associated protein 18